MTQFALVVFAACVAFSLGWTIAGCSFACLAGLFVAGTFLRLLGYGG